VPEYSLFDAGVFVLVKKSWKKLDVSGGLRVDQRQQEAKSLYLNADEEITTDQDLNATERFEGFNTRFTGLSGSLGLSYQISKNWNTKLNLSRGYRAPNISELGANGVHEGTIRYELGNADLKAESSLQVDFELGFATEHVNAKLNLFSNHINNYIFAKKLMTVQGSDSILEDHACYKFDAGNAQIQGGEFFIDFHPHPWDWLHFENGFSYVQAMLLNQPDSSKYLPFTPAAKWKSDIRVDFAKKNKYLNNIYLSFGIEHYFRQDNFYSANETETATPAYTLLNASLGTDFMWKKRRICSVYVTGSNLADIAYQSHLSRLKYAAENNVTGKTGVYNMGRNISLKLLVPVDL
jgi:iron complex outermembrane recepter protein